MTIVLSDGELRRLDAALTPTAVDKVRIYNLRCPESVIVGLPFQIGFYATVSMEDQPASRVVQLTINGEVVESVTASLPWNRQLTHYFTFSELTLTEAGIYNIAVNGLTATLEIVQPAENYVTFTGLNLVYDFQEVVNHWRSIQSSYMTCPICNRLVPTICPDYFHDWLRHVYGHYAYYNGWYWVDHYYPPGITHDQLTEYRRTINPLDYLTSELRCLADGEEYTLGPRVGKADNFDISQVTDIGFDGIDSWYKVEAQQSRMNPECDIWDLTMIVVPTDQYQQFLDDIQNPYRVCNYRGCQLCIEFEEHKGKPVRIRAAWPSGGWNYWYGATRCVREPMSIVSASGPVQLPHGDYIVLLVTDYRYEDGYFGEGYFSVSWAKCWEVGTISY